MGTIEEDVTQLKIALNTTEGKVKAHANLLDNLINDNRTFQKLAVSIELLAVETKYMRLDQNKANERLDQLEEKERKKWDQFKWAVLGAFLSLSVGIILYVINNPK